MAPDPGPEPHSPPTPSPATLGDIKVIQNPDKSVVVTGSLHGAVFTATKAADGSLNVSLSAPPPTVGAINWTALLQAIVNAIPAILAIITAFTG